MLQRGTIFHPSIFIIQLLFIPHFAVTLNWKNRLATSDYIINDAALASIWLSLCKNNPELQHQKIAPANIFMNQSVCEAWPLHFSFHPPISFLPPPPSPLPSSQRQVDPYEPSVSDAAPHTSPVWAPGDRWRSEGMG